MAVNQFQNSIPFYLSAWLYNLCFQPLSTRHRRSILLRKGPFSTELSLCLQCFVFSISIPIHCVLETLDPIHTAFHSCNPIHLVVDTTAQPCRPRSLATSAALQRQYHHVPCSLSAGLQFEGDNTPRLHRREVMQHQRQHRFPLLHQ